MSASGRARPPGGTQACAGPWHRSPAHEVARSEEIRRDPKRSEEPIRFGGGPDNVQDNDHRPPIVDRRCAHLCGWRAALLTWQKVRADGRRTVAIGECFFCFFSKYFCWLRERTQQQQNVRDGGGSDAPEGPWLRCPPTQGLGGRARHLNSVFLSKVAEFWTTASMICWPSRGRDCHSAAPPLYLY